MSEAEKLNLLEKENAKLKEDNEMMHTIIVQMKVTLNRLINRYMVESEEKESVS